MKKKPASKTTRAARPAAKPAARLASTIASFQPTLKKGEVHAGLAFIDGKPSHWLVLLPGDEKKNWKDAVAWAKKQGGELPTRKEQALLFANAPKEFQGNWYWSGEQNASDPEWAWYQNFYYGNQLNFPKSYEGRVRAVRRVPI